MKKHLFLFLTVLFFTGAAEAQTPAPTPTPAPKTTDAQNIKPENLEGVPAIAPKYQNDDLSLPNLGRVGVELLEQKPVSLNDVIKGEVENNKDEEVYQLFEQIYPDRKIETLNYNEVGLFGGLLNCTTWTMYE